MSASLLRGVAVVGSVFVIGCGGKPEVIQDIASGSGGTPSTANTLH